MNLDQIVKDLMVDEGRKVDARGRHILYKCPSDKWTIGYGHNIEDNGITDAVAVDILHVDAIEASRDAAALVPNWHALNDVRQGVLANMAMNLGRPKLAEFKKFLAAVNEGRYVDAANEMMASKWYGQVGKRAVRLRNEMLNGTK